MGAGRGFGTGCLGGCQMGAGALARRTNGHGRKRKPWEKHRRNSRKVTLGNILQKNGDF